MHNRPNYHIQTRAYHIWEAEGRPHGHHEKHWHQAEKEIYEEHLKEQQKLAKETPKAEPKKAAAPAKGKKTGR